MLFRDMRCYVCGNPPGKTSLSKGEKSGLTSFYAGKDGLLELEEIILAFPDGRYVGPGELDEWLSAVEAEPDFTEEELDLAHAIVLRIRALSN